MGPNLGLSHDLEAADSSHFEEDLYIPFECLLTKSRCSASMINYPETNSKFTPEKWMVGSDEFPFGFRPVFRGELLVLGRVYIFSCFFCGPLRLATCCYFFTSSTYK